MNYFGRYASVIFYIVLMLCMTLLDGLTGIYFSLWLLYFIPIGLVAWNLGVKTGWAFVTLALVLLFTTAFTWGNPYDSLYVLVWTYFSRATAYCLVVSLIGALRKKEVERVYVPPGVGH